MSTTIDTTITETTKPNLERIRELADFINDLPDESFNMGTWISNDCRPVHFRPQKSGSFRYDPSRTLVNAVQECGTSACIGGYAVLMFGNNQDLLFATQDNAYEEYVAEMAQQMLGLTDAQASRLFFPRYGGDLRDDLHVRPQDVTPQMAAAVLYDIIETTDHDFSWNNHCEERCCVDDGDYDDEDDDSDDC